ncbi:hypothetical protein PHYBOEH_008267 [Phytophthora boehmeriae]|uniref:Uncharacterized protein n=1 Tax=Phytophthora boehmeriae TaxID=109152 RepID=A0A8T1W274_9STRA|nr:hypothetical protein PHYBOEH_008267 [Phytophthora boehmeriae]
MRSNDSQKVIVVGIPKTLDDAQLSELFSDFGAVAEAKVVMDANTNASRGFGFVTFTAGSAMRAAIKGMNRKQFQGRTLNVRQLVPKDQFQSQQKDEPDPSKRPCWLLRKGKCTKGASCPFSHDIKDGEFGFCFEFKQTGACKRGDNCKFSHAAGQEEQSEEDEGAKPVEKKEAAPSKPEKRVCYSFQNGRCHRGSKCLYAHELLENGTPAGKGKKSKEQKTEKKTKEPFEVVTKTEIGKKRRRSEDEDTESQDDVQYAKKQEEKPSKVKPKKAPAASGLAAHVNNFMATQQKPKTLPKKFEWKAKTPVNSQQKQEPVKQEPQGHDEKEQEQEVQRPAKKFKTEKVDMGAAFDGISEDEGAASGGRKKRVVDKEQMRANRAKLTQERRAKRNAKKTALSKLMTKGEVELEA